MNLLDPIIYLDYKTIDTDQKIVSAKPTSGSFFAYTNFISSFFLFSGFNFFGLPAKV